MNSSISRRSNVDFDNPQMNVQAGSSAGGAEFPFQLKRIVSTVAKAGEHSISIFINKSKTQTLQQAGMSKFEFVKFGEVYTYTYIHGIQSTGRVPKPGFRAGGANMCFTEISHHII